MVCDDQRHHRRLMLASDLGRRVTGFGFVLFCTMNIAWIALVRRSQPDGGGLTWQNAILFAINLLGVWQYLLSPKNRRKMEVVKEAVAEFEEQEKAEGARHDVADSARSTTSSDTYRSYAAHNRALADELRERVAKAALGGPEKSRERHVARGKLLPRDRVERLLDPGSPFLEIGQLAACGMYDGEAPGAGMIAGIGRVSGRETMIVANDADGEGRRLFPDDGEEASARAGDRAAEPAALRLSGRQRRRQPAAPGRGVPRPRAFRPHLLQPGADERPGHRPDRLRDGQLHRRRRLCAGDVATRA